eukprot:3997872-Pyramimonas_sp.AAC.1
MFCSSPSSRRATSWCASFWFVRRWASPASPLGAGNLSVTSPANAPAPPSSSLAKMPRFKVRFRCGGRALLRLSRPVVA